MNEPPTTEDLLNAEECLRFLCTNLELQFDIQSDEWTESQMVENLKRRDALIAARTMLLDEVVRVIFINQS